MDKTDGGTFKKYIKFFCIASIIAICSLLILLVIFSLCYTVFSIPLALIPYITIFILSGSCLVGGYFNGRLVKNKGILCGTEISLLFSVIILCCSAIARKDIFTVFCVLKIAAMMLAGILGGILGVNSKGKRVKY